MDHCLEGISPTKFRYAPKWQVERESHVTLCIVMTIRATGENEGDPRQPMPLCDKITHGLCAEYENLKWVPEVP